MSLQVRESGGGGSEAIATCGYAAALAMQHMRKIPFRIHGIIMRW